MGNLEKQNTMSSSTKNLAFLPMLILSLNKAKIKENLSAKSGETKVVEVGESKKEASGDTEVIKMAALKISNSLSFHLRTLRSRQKKFKRPLQIIRGLEYKEAQMWAREKGVASRLRQRLTSTPSASIVDLFSAATRETFGCDRI